MGIGVPFQIGVWVHDSYGIRFGEAVWGIPAYALNGFIGYRLPDLFIAMGSWLRRHR